MEYGRHAASPITELSSSSQAFEQTPVFRQKHFDSDNKLRLSGPPTFTITPWKWPHIPKNRNLFRVMHPYFAEKFSAPGSVKSSLLNLISTNLTILKSNNWCFFLTLKIFRLP